MADQKIIDKAKSEVATLEAMLESQKKMFEEALAKDEASLRQFVSDHMKKSIDAIETHLANEQIKLHTLERTFVQKIKDYIAGHEPSIAGGLTTMTLLALPVFGSVWYVGNISAALLSLGFLVLFGTILSFASTLAKAPIAKLQDFWQGVIAKIIS